ncbi:MAG: hypothetical protein Q8909_14185, partial [Bacteroidota bacterium]|nr:hypothetical protein [Bacteroidota bacterium]
VDRIEIINELKADFNLRSILQIVLDIDVNPVESTLSLGFNQNIIRFLYLTNTVIDVDIYRFSSTDKYE